MVAVAGKQTALKRPNKSTSTAALAVLNVQSGLHKGAKAAINQSEVAIGSDLDNDVVLTDPGILNHHCDITLYRRFGKLRASIEATEQSIVANGQDVAAGKSISLKLPIVLDLKGTKIELVPQLSGRTFDKALPIGLGIGICTAIAASSLEYANLTGDMSPMPVPAAAAAMQAKPAPKALNTAASALEARLVTANLKPMLSVTRGLDGVSVEGVLDAAGYAKWREVKQAFQEAGNRETVIFDQVKASTVMSPPKNLIATAVFGANPYVVSTTGRKATLGQPLDDGWVVTAITPKLVTLKRGEVEYKYNLGTGR